MSKCRVTEVGLGAGFSSRSFPGRKEKGVGKQTNGSKQSLWRRLMCVECHCHWLSNSCYETEWRNTNPEMATRNTLFCSIKKGATRSVDASQWEVGMKICLKMTCDNGQNSWIFYTNLSFLLMSVNTGSWFSEFLFILFWYYYLSIITNKCGVSHLEKKSSTF